MKSKLIFASLTSMTMLAISSAATAASITINTPATAFLVTEAHTPTGVAATVYNGSIGYIPGLWAPGNVLSATLTLFLKDDVASNQPPFIDAPREWAKLLSVADGTSLLSPAGSVEVDPELFVADQVIGGHTVTASEALQAASVGAENLFGPTGTGMLPSTAGYFNLDVSGLLNTSNTGLLSFMLGVDAQYADIPVGSPAYFAIDALTAVPPGQPIYMIEDFIFDHAQLTVNYVPEPSGLALLALGLTGFLGLRRKAVKS